MLFTLLNVGFAFASSVIEVETLKTHSRLRLKIDETISSQIKSTDKGFEITIQGLRPQDLGMSSGVITTQDTRMGDVKVTAHGENTLITGSWKQRNMEIFDYRQKTPPSLIIDYWSKGGLSTQQLHTIKKTQAQKNRWKEAQKQVARLIQEIQRREARRKEVTDPNRFCRGTRKEETEIFLPFKPAHQPIDFTQWMSTTTPDKNYPYLKTEGQSEEEKTVRLAYELYEKGKHALVFKAVEFLKKDYPKSKFMEDMIFLQANTKLKMGQTAEAERDFKDIMMQYPKSAPAYTTAFFLATNHFSKEEYLQAMDSFMWLIARYPDHPLSWVFHLGAAECLYAIRETSKSQQEYEWVEKHAKDSKFRAEASLRIGDLYMNREQYPEALTAYSRAIKKYPEDSKRLPIVFINRAEALYWLGEYKRSGEEFESFLKNHGSHPMGWRAAFRLGELADRSSDAKVRDLGRKWYQRTINDYPVSAGAALARARLMVCGDHGGFTFELAEVFFKDESQIRRIEREIASDETQDFLSLARARTYQSLAPSEETLGAIEDELEKPMKSKTRDELRALLLIALRTEVLELLSTNQDYLALQMYKSYRELLPFKTDPDLVDFMLKLSQAALDLELPTVAQMVLQDYRERWGARSNPGAEMALKRADEYFTEAKMLWDAGSTSEEAKIREALDKIPELSEYHYQKTVLLGQMEEKKGNTPNAIIYASKALALAAGKKEKPVIQYWLAKLLSQAARYGAAAKILSEIEFDEDEINFMGLEDFPDESRLVEMTAENYEKDQNWGKAAEYYERLADAGENPSNRSLYQLAMALEKLDAKQGNSVAVKQTVKKILKQVSESKTNDFWKELALEALENRSKTRARQEPSLQQN